MKTPHDEQHPVVEYSVAGDRGIATMSVLAAVKRWLGAVDNHRAACDTSSPWNHTSMVWPLARKQQHALEDLEEAARVLQACDAESLRE